MVVGPGTLEEAGGVVAALVAARGAERRWLAPRDRPVTPTPPPAALRAACGDKPRDYEDDDPRAAAAEGRAVPGRNGF